MMEKSRKVLCYIYWGLMFVVYPFVMTDGYFNISKAKLTGFYIVSIVLIVGTLFNLIMMTNKRRILFLNEIKENRIFIGLCTGCFLSILLTGIINKNLIYSMGGEYEYGVGFIFLTVLIINVLCANGFHGNSIVYTYLALAPGCMVATMSLLQYIYGSGCCWLACGGVRRTEAAINRNIWKSGIYRVLFCNIVSYRCIWVYFK